MTDLLTGDLPGVPGGDSGEGKVMREQPEQPKHHKRGGQRKPFVIEARYIGRMGVLRRWREWHIYSRYRTERDMNNALLALRKPSRWGWRRGGYWEYRKQADTKGETNDD